jgi:CRP-like cAMP-binding protein
MSTKAEKLLAKGRGLEKKGKRDKALELYRDACRAEPYDPELWTARAETAEALGLAGEAAEALFHVCDLYARTGMQADALVAVKRVLVLDKGHSGARRLLRLLDREEPAPEAPPPPVAAAPQPAPDPELEPAPEPDPEPEPDPVVELTADMAKRKRAPTRPPPTPEADIEQHFDEAFEQAFDEVALRAAGAGLDSFSLVEKLPQSRPVNGGSASEIPLEEDTKLDVVQAVASTLSSSPLLFHRQTEEPVFRQGDFGSSLFLILAGEVAVLAEPPKGTPRELARLRPGAFFGEMALLTNGPRSASVVAQKPSDFLEVSRKAVRELVDRDPRVLKLLMRFFRARLVGTLLQTSPLFRGFSRDERRDLVARFRLREVASSYAVITEGDAAEGLFVVLVGRLDVVQGEGIRLGVLGVGDVFGEMSLLDEGHAMASVKTRGRAWVLLLPRDDFYAVAERHPELRDQLAALAADRRERNRLALSPGRGRISEERVEPV